MGTHSFVQGKTGNRSPRVQPQVPLLNDKYTNMPSTTKAAHRKPRRERDLPTMQSVDMHKVQRIQGSDLTIYGSKRFNKRLITTSDSEMSMLHSSRAFRRHGSKETDRRTNDKLANLSINSNFQPLGI
jgi:hypothetical protein